MLPALVAGMGVESQFPDGAVVTRDVLPGNVVVGVSARDLETAL